MVSKWSRLFLICFILVFGIGCSPSGQPEQPTTITEAASVPTDTPPEAAPAAAETPTQLPTETPTLLPTDTPTITPTFSPAVLRIQPGEPVRIGSILAEQEFYGIDSKRSIELAIAESGGELLGHPIELLGYDSECTRLGGQRAAQILAADASVLGVIGTSCSVGAFAAAPILSSAGRVLISPSNTSPELTAPDTYQDGYFRIAPNDIFQVKAAADFAFKQLGARRMATVANPNQMVTQLQGDYICQVFGDLGGECVLQRLHEPGNLFMTPLLNSILEAQADVVYIMLGDFQAAAALIAEAKTTPGLENIALIVWQGLNSPELLAEAGESAVGVYVSTTSFEFDRESAAYQDFLNRYRNAYGEDPTSEFHAYAYDAAKILLGAIEQVAVPGDDGSLMVDPEAIRAALYSLRDYPGLSGLLTCNALGDCAVSATGRVYEFVSGDPETFNPGPADSLSSNPSQVWP